MTPERSTDHDRGGIATRFQEKPIFTAEIRVFSATLRSRQTASVAVGLLEPGNEDAGQLRTSILADRPESNRVHCLIGQFDGNQSSREPSEGGEQLRCGLVPAAKLLLGKKPTSGNSQRSAASSHDTGDTAGIDVSPTRASQGDH